MRASDTRPVHITVAGHAAGIGFVLSPAEVGKEIERHSTRGSGQEDDRRQLIALATVLLVLSLIQVATLPKPRP